MRVRRPCPSCGKSRLTRARRYPDPEWFADLAAGDILRFGQSYRRVLSVNRNRDGRLFAVSLNRVQPGYAPGIGRTDGPVPYFASELRTSGARRVSGASRSTPRTPQEGR